jgi:hypothetical protein
MGRSVLSMEIPDFVLRFMARADKYADGFEMEKEPVPLFLN